MLFCDVSSAEEVIFVGSPICATDTEKSCMDYVEKGGLCLDAAFELVYRVEQSINGSVGEKVKFIGFYHYHGLPNYVVYGKALLHLKSNHNGQLILANLKPLYSHELSEDSEVSELVYCNKWSEEDEDECEEIVQVEDLANEWLKTNE